MYATTFRRFEHSDDVLRHYFGNKANLLFDNLYRVYGIINYLSYIVSE